ncbi:hypothetical protein BDU57DRAFT_523341 [Ampelomyces quisqualis]|uniref:Uncharacterized protein n=1 Tax=Ampelomyces quisqualis TaxID=50730 RepID=A0A6A5QB27_AMPQU|nr:hypothetical protein BDU57DRAFT_523341 [Ampelomyces quisqualis]
MRRATSYGTVSREASAVFFFHCFSVPTGAVEFNFHGVFYLAGNLGGVDQSRMKVTCLFIKFFFSFQISEWTTATAAAGFEYLLIWPLDFLVGLMCGLVALGSRRCEAVSPSVVVIALSLVALRDARLVVGVAHDGVWNWVLGACSGAADADSVVVRLGSWSARRRVESTLSSRSYWSWGWGVLLLGSLLIVPLMILLLLKLGGLSLVVVLLHLLGVLGRAVRRTKRPAHRCIRWCHNMKVLALARSRRSVRRRL